VTGNPVAAQSLICDLRTVAVVHGSDNHMFVQIHQPGSTGVAMLVIRAAGKRQPLAFVAPNDRAERRLLAGLGR
jgi:hypothetical protein